MADWYVSSAAFATYTAFQISHAYSVGDIIVPTAPAAAAKYVLRCTTAGTSAGTEPTWSGNNNATTTSGTAVFTNITGQSAFFWTAAAGDQQTLNGSGSSTFRFASGDRCFLSSDHTETISGGAYGSPNSLSAGYGVLQHLSVNRAGSTPPVAADLTPGAAIIANALLTIRSSVNQYFYGVTLSLATAAGGNQIGFDTASGTVWRSIYLDTCSVALNNNSGASITGNNTKLILDNTTIQFGHASQILVFAGIEVVWINTPAALPGATFPTILFSIQPTVIQNTVSCRGIDLSSLTGTLVRANGGTAARFLLYGCKIASGVTRYANTVAVSTVDLVELVNCYDGTNFINERYTPAGTLTTERTITLSSGATDDVGVFAHKLVSTANVDKFAQPFESFWMDVEYTTTGASKTATVEIISSGTLNNDEIYLALEYQGTAGSSLASLADSFITTPLTPAAAVTTSTATWNSSPATPQKQKLQVTFTPQVAGRVRGIVRLGKASTTVYINPQIAIT